VGRRVAPMPPNPVRGRLSSPPRGVGPSVPWAGSPRPRGGSVCRSVGGPAGALPRKGGGGSWGARLAVLPLRGGAAVPAASVGPRPRRGLGSRRPRWRCGLSGTESPVWSGLPPGFGLPRKVERVHRGRDCHLAGGGSSWLRRRNGAVRFRVGFAGAEAPGWASAGPRLLRRGRSSFGASAVGPSVGRPRPRGGLGCPGAAAVFPSGPKAFWSPCFAEARRGQRCVVFSSGPKAFGGPCFAEARRGRHGVSFSVWPEGCSESLLCRSAAGPTRPGAAEAVPGGASAEAGAVPLEGVAPKRAALGLPVTSRSLWVGGGRVLSSASRQAALRRGGAFLVLERARATAPVEGGWNH
jgi:hypothetical protein